MSGLTFWWLWGLTMIVVSLPTHGQNPLREDMWIVGMVVIIFCMVVSMVVSAMSWWGK